MRAPTKSEKLLLVVFAAMLLFLLGILLWRALQQNLRGRHSADAALVAQIEELRGWTSQKDLWLERGAWLQENPPPAWDRETSEAELVQKLQSTLASNGIDIVGQRLIGTSEISGYREIAVQLTLRGTTEEIVRWLNAIQQPGEFIAIRQLNLRADQDKESLRVEVSLVRHYREVDGPSPVPQIDAGEEMSADEPAAVPADVPATEPDKGQQPPQEQPDAQPDAIQ